MRLSNIAVVLCALLTKSALGDNALKFNDRPPLDDGNVEDAFRSKGLRDRRRMQLDKTCREPFYQLLWANLPSDAKRSAAQELGYTSSTWNNDEDPDYMDTTSWKQFSEANQTNWRSLDVNPGIYENGFEDFFFSELPTRVQNAAKTIGYDDPSSWDADQFSPLMAKIWSQLSDAEKDAAIVVGFDCFQWTLMNTEMPTASIGARADDAIDELAVMEARPICPPDIFGRSFDHTPCDQLSLSQCHLACHCKICPGKDEFKDDEDFDDDPYDNFNRMTCQVKSGKGESSPDFDYCPKAKSAKANTASSSSSKRAKSGGDWHCVPSGVDVASADSSGDDCDECITSCCGECCRLGCFPKDAIVNVLGKGDITMDTLEIGDKVRTAFAFGHTDEEERHDYVRLQTNDAAGTTLELSPNHIVFVGKRGEPKMAKDVVIGDTVQVSGKSPADSQILHVDVLSIEIIKKEGQYAPLTEAGTIIVNNVLASVHSIEGAAPQVKIFGITLIDIHQFEQMLFAPLRLLCMFSFDDFCSPAFHDEEGTHNWDSVTEHLIDMLTFDAPDLESTNFLSLSVTLPFKIFVLGGMVTAHVAEKVFTMSLSSILFGLATFLYTAISIKRTYAKKKIE